MRAIPSSAIAIVCPGCAKAGRISRPGTVTCPVCKTPFNVDQTGRTWLAKAKAPVVRASSRPAFNVPVAARPAPVGLDLLPDVPDALEEEKAAERHALCARHPDAKAYEACTRCGDFVCAACRQWSRGGVQCPGCIAPTSDDPMVPLGVFSVLESTLGAAVDTGWRGLVMAILPSVATPMMVSAIVSIALGAPLLGAGGTIGSLVVVVLLGFVLASWLTMRSQAGLFALVRGSLAGRRIGLGEAFAYGSGRCFWVLLTQVLAAFLACAPYVVPVVVGLTTRSWKLFIPTAVGAAIVSCFLAVRWCMIVPVALNEGAYFFKALGRSSEIVAWRGFTVFLTFLVAGLLLGVFGMVAGFAMPYVPPQAMWAAEMLSGAMNMVLSTSLVTTLYFALASTTRRARG